MVLKEINTRTVLGCLRESGTATVRELAQQSGLSVVTVKAIVEDLVHQEKAFSGGKAPSSGDRPSQRYIFNKRHTLGMAVFTREVNGGDTVFLRVVDLCGETIDAVSCELSAPEPEVLERIIGEKVREFPRLGAIVLGLPGIEYKGDILALDYQSFVGLPLAKHLRTRFEIPVVVENDVNAAVLGRECEAYIYFPRKYPPGAGLRIEGKLLKGHRHFAGEVGWLPLGISWGPEIADSFEACCSAAARVTASVTALIDPASIVLYGEHLGEDHLRRIRDIYQALLPAQALPEIHCSEDFTADFERGLKKILLDLLEEDLPEADP
ncbi:hypothetical protein AU468_00210 [Alkalispirochaeta sphaeroplastigenens]|uniref:ROK family transcriptional regulator n=2 Tax=Alkalispirochaeta sphaeroplastigenens TaxID=1187066 RepID=A0A2S4K1J6_9SPIO|nr:hypothetical protein AU468_00210 [Alkalispirochaeta sphaeroplastigenens]